MSALKPTLRETQSRVCCQCKWHPRISPTRRRGIDMAKGVLGGVLGDENEKPEVETQEARPSAEAFAAAVAAIASRQDPQGARGTSQVLNKQSRLLDIQAKHLEDEHAARLHYLLGQAREVDIRRFGLRLRVGFQVFIALVATVIGSVGAVMLHGRSEEHT